MYERMECWSKRRTLEDRRVAPNGDEVVQVVVAEAMDLNDLTE